MAGRAVIRRVIVFSSNSKVTPPIERREICGSPSTRVTSPANSRNPMDRRSSARIRKSFSTARFTKNSPLLSSLRTTLTTTVSEGHAEVGWRNRAAARIQNADPWNDLTGPQVGKGRYGPHIVRSGRNSPEKEKRSVLADSSRLYTTEVPKEVCTEVV